MLDLQRRKQKPRSAPAILFTRSILAVHLLMGLLAMTLLLFHELFLHSAFVILWLMSTCVLVWPILHRQQWARVLLGLLLALGAASALFYLVWIVPTLDRDVPVILTLRVLPFWLTLVAAAYGGLSLLILVSSRVRRATEKGFSLLEVPDSLYD